jgi:hypothetical protein
MATMSSSGPFSSLPNIDRLITILPSSTVAIHDLLKSLRNIASIEAAHAATAALPSQGSSTKPSESNIIDDVSLWRKNDYSRHVDSTSQPNVSVIHRMPPPLLPSSLPTPADSTITTSLPSSIRSIPSLPTMDEKATTSTASSIESDGWIVPLPPLFIHSFAGEWLTESVISAPRRPERQGVYAPDCSGRPPPVTVGYQSHIMDFNVMARGHRYTSTMTCLTINEPYQQSLSFLCGVSYIVFVVKGIPIDVIPFLYANTDGNECFDYSFDCIGSVDVSVSYRSDKKVEENDSRLLPMPHYWLRVDMTPKNDDAPALSSHSATDKIIIDISANVRSSQILFVTLSPKV